MNDDRPANLTFTVAIDDARQLHADLHDERLVSNAGTEARRKYITSTFRRRLHQQAFRERVLEAYRAQCALCRLRHEELLDAAHIWRLGGHVGISRGSAGGARVILRYGSQTLRRSYATPWNSWTLVETLDKKRGQHFKKP
jgi:hypothetical protein